MTFEQPRFELRGSLICRSFSINTDHSITGSTDAEPQRGERTVKLFMIFPRVEGGGAGTANSHVVQESTVGASLVAQWLRICLLMQGTRVRALVWEDPTCHGATRSVSHNY